MLKSIVSLALVLGTTGVHGQLSTDPVCESDMDCLLATCNTNGPNPDGVSGLFYCNQPNCSGEGRRTDGICNNLEPGQAYFGSTFEQQTRSADASRSNLQNNNEALDVSDTLLNTFLPTPNTFGKSNLLIIFGQFIDHDITLIELEGANDVRTIVGDGSIPDISFPLSRRVGPENIDNPNFINEISALLDLTQVYGGEEERLDALRQGSGGRMTTQIVGGDEFLPAIDQLNEPISMAMDNIPESFAAGDIRANEQVILTAFHTLFLRNHNKLAAQFTAAGQDDEEAFENARARNIAEYQNIVYQEFLPALLGAGPLPPYRGYDSSVSPAVGLAFSTALYRMGHSGVANQVLSVDEDGNRATRILGDVFFNPQAFLDQPNAVGAFLLGSKMTCHERIDMEMQDSLRRLLFGNTGPAQDLGALNIERGRDHQLESFNDIRRSLGMSPTSVNQLNPDNRCVADDIRSMFGSDIDAVPVFVAALAEGPQDNSQVGDTIRNAMIDQFTRLRDGDRYYFENSDANGPGFSDNELRAIRRTTLSDVIVRNTFVPPSLIGIDAFSSDQCCSTGGNNAENLMCMRRGNTITMEVVDLCEVENLAAINGAFYPGTVDPLTLQQYDCNCLLANGVVSGVKTNSAGLGVLLALGASVLAL